MVREGTIIWEDLKGMVNDPVYSEMLGKRILLSGATGFVGYYLVESLVKAAKEHKKEIKIFAIVRNRQKGIEKYKEFYQEGYIDFIEQDICAPIKCDEPVDYVIHMASNAAPKEYLAMPAETMLINFLGTKNMLEYARKVQIQKFLFVSTIEVYGSGHGEEAIKEADYGTIDALNVRSCYPMSKKASETLAISYQEEYGIPVVVGRLSYLYGPGMGANDSKVVAQFTRDAVAGKDIVLKSKGAQRRTYCYISDAVRGMLHVLVHGETGNAYNITNGMCITTISEMAQCIAELEKDSGIQVRYEIPSESEKKRFSLIDDAVMDTEKIESIGFASQVNLKTGLFRMLQSLRESY